MAKSIKLYSKFEKAVSLSYKQQSGNRDIIDWVEGKAKSESIIMRLIIVAKMEGKLWEIKTEIKWNSSD